MFRLISPTRSFQVLSSQTRSFHSSLSLNIFKPNKWNFKKTRARSEKYYTQKATSTELDSLGRTINRRAPRRRPDYWPHEGINMLIDEYIGEPKSTITEIETFIKKPQTNVLEKNTNRLNLDYSALFQNKQVINSLNLSPSKSSSDIDTVDKEVDDYIKSLPEGIPRTRRSRSLLYDRPTSTSLFSVNGIRMMDPEEAAKINLFNDTSKIVSKTLNETAKKYSKVDDIEVTSLSSFNNDEKIIITPTLNSVRPVPLKFEGVYPDEPVEITEATTSSDLKVEPRIVKEVESRTAKKQILRSENNKSLSGKFNIFFPSQNNTKEENEILNVSIPKSKSKELMNIYDSSSSLEGYLDLNDSDDNAKKIEGILKMVSNEVSPTWASKVDRLAEFDKGVKKSLQRLAELKSSTSESNSDSILDKELEMKKFQNFLRNANATKKREDEQEFRELRAYEWSKLMSDKNAHTFNKHNFFSPIDESLLKKTINSALNPNYRNFQNNEDPEALFPKFENQTAIERTYFTLNPNDLSSPVSESNSNPFGSSYRAPALLQLIKELSEDSNYKQLLIKIDEFALNGWKFIGIGHDSTLKNKVLVFEKTIDPNLERRNKRLKAFRTILSVTFGISTLVLIFSVLNDRKLLQ